MTAGPGHMAAVVTALNGLRESTVYANRAINADTGPTVFPAERDAAAAAKVIQAITVLDIAKREGRS